MGAALSMQKFLATPLSAQWKFPFVVNPRYCRRRDTTLELTDNFWTHAMDINGYGVREVDSGRVLFRVLPAIDGEAADGRTKWLVDEYGIPVAHMTLRDDPNAASFDVCLGKRRQSTAKVLTTLRVKFVPGRGEPLLAEVDDPHTGGKSRVGCHGMWRQRAAVLYLERGRGGRREPIAKVYRPAGGRMTTFGGNAYHVETAIGVDMALVLLICAAMDDASVHFHKAHRHPLLGSSRTQ
ncbi:hypothetical protein PR003_g28200 [Phytophthora rubi]|uniref:Tubby C-terminal domain-containing protein n=1 Tax=Phytophthora rubi TaxID=129364 RepID=A0A6A3HSL5_9STRA|nr:hypothetical protein PR001_g27005 [Phytophthora rubi]KAE9279568.1 hypothetical protein PR003_g28200 [Phytophthora rubi]